MKTTTKEQTRRARLVTGLLVMASLAACGGDRTLSAQQACEEQAEMMCGTQPPTLDLWSAANCRAGYMADCIPANHGVGIDQHVACLDAIFSNAIPQCVPAACSATWGDPERVAHFCRD